MLGICRLLPLCLPRVAHQLVRDNSRRERVASEPWRLDAVAPGRVHVRTGIRRKEILRTGILHRAILRCRSRLHQRVLGYSLRSEVGFLAFLRSKAVQVTDKLAIEAVLLAESPESVKVAEWLYAGEESEMQLIAAALPAVL